METRFLETFLLVVELGSIAEASRKLNITPAAVAQRVRALEQQVGTELLTRAGHKVRATDAGNAICDQARGIVRDVRRLRAIAMSDLPSGELRIGAVSTAITGILPRALRALRQENDQIDVHIHPAKSGELYRSVQAEELDAAILVYPYFPMAKSLDWCLLRSENLVLICPEDWKHEDPDHLLATRPFIQHDRQNWGGRLAEAYLQRTGQPVNEWMELNSLEAITVMVDAGLGVSIVPRWPPPWPDGVSVALLPLPVPFEPRHIGLIWSRASPSQGLISILLKHLKAASDDTPDPEVVLNDRKSNS